MMSPSHFLGVRVNVLIDEAAAAEGSKRRLEKEEEVGSQDTPIDRKVRDERKRIK